MTKKIEDSLYTLYHIGNHIDLIFKAIVEIHSDLEKYNLPISEFDKKLTFGRVAISGLTNNILILSCSYLEE